MLDLDSDPNSINSDPQHCLGLPGGGLKSGGEYPVGEQGRHQQAGDQHRHQPNSHTPSVVPPPPPPPKKIKCKYFMRRGLEFIIEVLRNNGQHFLINGIIKKKFDSKFSLS
jgi:hypothetical protein